jgi:hypothetical protein
MIAGHFGFAALVKSRERQVPLWALMLAAAWLDIVFVPFFMTGVERLQTAPGTHGGYGNGIIYADYTHSFVGMLVLSAANSLVAGGFDTEMLHTAKSQLAGDDPAQFQGACRANTARIPPSFGTAEEAALAASWPCRDTASYVTGLSLIADRGLAAWVR